MTRKRRLPYSNCENYHTKRSTVKKERLDSNREVDASTTSLTPEGYEALHDSISPLTESSSRKSTALISTETSLGSNKRT